LTLIQHYQQAYSNFAAAKLRSFLAVLGILIGTAAVVALLSCGKLATDKALTEFKTLGTNLLTINVYHNDKQAPHPQDDMSVHSWHQLANRVKGIKKIAPFTSVYQKIVYQGYPLDGVVIGADESLAEIIHIHLTQGYFVSFVEASEHYCVLGKKIAQKIQNSHLEDPMGKQIQIGAHIYTIIGIADSWTENAFFNYDVNRAVMIPLGGMDLLSLGNGGVNNVIASLNPNVSIDKVINEIRENVSYLAPKQEIFIRSAKQMIASMESQARIFTLLLTVIGSISLLVGGIGVMNVMLVSVSERKKEIGIRKAIGARAHDIKLLFLMESVLLALFGGVLGVLLGELLTCIIAYTNDWLMHLYVMPPLAGFAVSTIFGVFFGYYPAKRAALLEPIVSLRGD